MASGPWDNVQLAGPPNGPAYINSAMNAASTLGNLVNSGFNAYRQGQDFQYQQQQRNFFQDPNNQGILQQALQGNPQPLQSALIQQGGLPMAAQLMPQIMQAAANRNTVNNAWGQPNGNSNNGPPNPTAPDAGSPSQIVPNYGRQQGPPQSSPYYTREQVLNNTGDNSGGSSIDQLAAERQLDLHDFLAANPWAVKFVGNDNLTQGEQNRITGAMKRYIGGGNSNPVQSSGTDEQETGGATAKAAAGNELKPASVQGGPPISPAPTSGAGKIGSAAAPPSAIAGDGLEDQRNRRTRTAQAQPNFNQRFEGIPTQAQIDQKLAEGDRKLRAAASGTYSDKETREAIKDAGNKDIELAKQMQQQRFEALQTQQKQQFELNKPTDLEKNVRRGATAEELTLKGNIPRYQKVDTGLEAAERSSEQMNKHLQTMDGILEDPRLFTSVGQVNVNWLRQAAQNYLPRGVADPNGTLAVQALKKVTSQNMLNQLDQLKADAEEMGGSAGRVMLAQIKIMQDASQNPDISIPTLRYLTEIGHRAVQENREIGDLRRDYKAKHNDQLDSGFEQVMVNYERNHPLITQAEERNINLLAAPRLPTNFGPNDTDKVRDWARQHGLNAGDPMRTNRGYPARYVPAP